MKIEILEITKEVTDWGVIHQHRVELPALRAAEYTRIGLDPGYRKMGMAIIWPNNTRANAYQFDLNRFEFTNDQSHVPLQRMLLVQKAIGQVLIFAGHTKAVVEGSSYAERFKQTQLAEARAAAILKLHDYEIDVAVIPPLKIRKNVFGDGKTKAKDLWPDLKPDAAAALACALYKEEKNVLQSEE